MKSVHQQRGMGRPAPPKSHAGRNDQVISDLTDKFVPVLETGVAFGYLNGICKAVCLNKPVTCDRLLGFRKRAVRYHLSAAKNFALIREATYAFYLSSLVNRSNQASNWLKAFRISSGEILLSQLMPRQSTRYSDLVVCVLIEV